MAKNAKTDVWKTFSAGPGRLHESYEGSECLLRELGIFGWLRFHKAFDQALEPAKHDGEFEIHFVVNGELNWWVEDDHYKLTPGTVLVIKPGEWHGSQTGVLEPCEHFWFRIQISDSTALPGMTVGQTRQLKTRYEEMSLRAFQVSEAVHGYFEQILDEHRERSDLSRLASRSALHLLLTAVLRDFDNQAAKPVVENPSVSKRIQKCIDRIQADLEMPPPIGELARLAGLSESAFRRRFREETGGSPHDFITLQRVQEARHRLLNTDRSVIDIAMDLGFSSSQYFATVFKRKTGISPRQYREKYG